MVDADEIFHTTTANNNLDAHQVEQELRSRLQAHLLGRQELESIREADIPKLALFAVEVLDGLRELTNLLNRYFSSLYSLSDDQSLIANLAGLAQGLHSADYSVRLFHCLVSQHRLLASLLVVVKLKSIEDLRDMKFEVAIVLDILWNSRICLTSAAGR